MLTPPAPTARRFAAVLFVCLALVRVAARSDDPDLDALARIQEEGTKRSQMMDTVSYLTDVHGPRLTNSPQMRAAAEWAVGRLRSWDIPEVRTESWGPFGRGWSNERLTVNVLDPVPWPVLAYPMAWTPGTNGVVAAEAVMAVIETEEEFEQWRGKLKGRVVLIERPRSVKPLFDGLATRRSEKELKELEDQQPQPQASSSAFNAGGNEFAQRRARFFQREGVVATFQAGPGRGDHGSLLVMGPSQNREPDAMPSTPQIVLATEHYGRIARMLERKIPVRLQLDVANRFHEQPLDSLNILAEIPGTDKADEVVMLGAHFDSWHTGTGATDNAAGSAAVMEALRILKATGLKLRRTVRIALWTGEEQGLLGSRAYVAQQFADRKTMTLKPAHAKLSAYFNMDNGTGAIRGVFLQNNEAARPIFRAWMEPLQALGMTTLTIRGTGGTDHLSFDEVGLPGFQFIQDPVEYFSYSHHSNMDLFERVQADDLTKNAVILASFAYMAATRDELLPRKPLPAPRPPVSAQ